MLTLQETLVDIDRKADAALALLEIDQTVPSELAEAASQFAQAATTALDALGDGDDARFRERIGSLVRTGDRAHRLAECHITAGERSLSTLKAALDQAAIIARDWS